MREDARFYPGIIVAGIATDVGHPNIQALPDLTLVRWIPGANGCSINVPIDCHQGADAGEHLHYMIISNIAGMPDLITFTKMMSNSRIIKTMGI